MSEESFVSNIVTHDCYSDFIKKDLELNCDDFTFTKPGSLCWSQC
jgi:hypothetical protein